MVSTTSPTSSKYMTRLGMSNRRFVLLSDSTTSTTTITVWAVVINDFPNNGKQEDIEDDREYKKDITNHTTPPSVNRMTKLTYQVQHIPIDHKVMYLGIRDTIRWLT